MLESALESGVMGRKRTISRITSDNRVEIAIANIGARLEDVAKLLKVSRPTLNRRRAAGWLNPDEVTSGEIDRWVFHSKLSKQILTTPPNISISGLIKTSESKPRSV